MYEASSRGPMNIRHGQCPLESQFFALFVVSAICRQKHKWSLSLDAWLICVWVVKMQLDVGSEPTL